MDDTRFINEKGELDYQKYGADLARLFEATANLLEREWPTKYKQIDSARTIFSKRPHSNQHLQYNHVHLSGHSQGPASQTGIRPFTGATDTYSF